MKKQQEIKWMKCQTTRNREENKFCIYIPQNQTTGAFDDPKYTDSLYFSPSPRQAQRRNLEKLCLRDSEADNPGTLKQTWACICQTRQQRPACTTTRARRTYHVVQLLHNTLDDFRFTLQQFWSKFLIQPGLKEGTLSVKARKTSAIDPHQREGKNTATAPPLGICSTAPSKPRCPGPSPPV